MPCEMEHVEKSSSFTPPPPSSPPTTILPLVYVPSSDAPGGGTAGGATPDPSLLPRPTGDADVGPQGVAAVSENDSSRDGVFGNAPDDLAPLEEEAACSASAPAVIYDELHDRIVKQVEYYFCDENLVTDRFLLRFIKKNKAGYGLILPEEKSWITWKQFCDFCACLPIAVIASFRRMKKLSQELSLIADALRTSSQLVMSEDGTKVKRLHPFLGDVTIDAMDGNKVKKAHPSQGVETTDTMSRTILVDNLADDSSKESIQRIFSKPGNIVKVTLHDPRSADKSAGNSRSGVIISSKVHAIVEYETIEAAELAVSSLNDDQNWRSGMRVELLLKRMEKHGLVPKGSKTSFVEKNNGTQVEEPTADGGKISEDDHDEVARKEEGERNKGGRRSRYKNRGRGQQKDAAHGFTSPAEMASKPIQGPRMPDGTKGFTLGRGKPAF